MNNSSNSHVQTVFKGVRSSKFRHVYGCAAKKELCYDNLKITKNANDSQFCSVNPKFLAVVTETAGGGGFYVIPLEKYGRIEANYGRVCGHKGPVSDIKWNPFNDNIIASCSDDCTIKLWYIPDEGVPKRGMNDCFMTLDEHKRRVTLIEWHPTADNILASVGFDHLILIWNTSTGQVVRTINCHSDTIHSLSFNRDGSLIATTCKDKYIRIIDPLRAEIIECGLGHEGSKASKVVFLGDTGRLFTTGFSKYSDRQWAVWSQYDLSSPLRIENIDSSSGVLFPFYDHDTKMVYVAGKGDGSIRYYEVINEPPWCYYISQYITGFPQRGLGVMPKRGLDVHRCEVFRFYKLHASKPQCEPISMIVPRKSHLFQADLYPDTLAPTPALTSDEWLKGKRRSPVLMSMKTGAGAKTHKPVMFKNDNSLANINLNNDRKFIFLSQENIVDYRSKPYSTSMNGSTTVDDHQLRVTRSKLPWVHNEPKENNVTIHDIVQKQHLPIATFVTLSDNENENVQQRWHENEIYIPQEREEVRHALNINHKLK
ncbi:coronin-2B-like protein [Dinothrombium tinctorium]|uniref:Coronin n=1 Tax=Dinothrombium tinctorium TaxID=1965070 RepID=A0A3S3S380_9ACAR|nr:coronin-2B-like protein [Dinothrombium tinctorium]